MERQEKLLDSSKRPLEVYDAFQLHSSSISVESVNTKQIPNHYNIMMTNGINKKVQEGRINAQEKPVIIALIKSVTITRESNVTIAYTEYQMHNMVQFCCKELGFALDTTFSLCGIY